MVNVGIWLSGDDFSTFPGHNIEQWVKAYHDWWPNNTAVPDITLLRNDQLGIYLQIAENHIAPDPSGDFPNSREELRRLYHLELRYSLLLIQASRRLHDRNLRMYHSEFGEPEQAANFKF